MVRDKRYGAHDDRAKLVKADVTERTATHWSADGYFPCEPVFVPAPDATAEDEGVVLSLLVGPHDHSSLLVLDAGSMDELARAELPHQVPFGFHGMFTRH